MNDFVNGLFELGGAYVLLLHVRRLHLDRCYRGVSPWPFVFFTAWGWWNALWYYPSLDQWWSFAGGVAVVAVNSVYCWLLWKYRNN